MEERRITTKGSKYRAGSISNQVPIYYEKQDPASRDRENRSRVVAAIGQLIDEGKSLDEAVSILLSNEEVLKQFNYMRVQGINLGNSFKGWYNGSKKKTERNFNASGKANECR